MAVYTSINISDLKDWIKKFDLRDLIDFKGISSGVTNSNYLIHMSDSKYILTIFEHNNIHELPFYVDLMTHLVEQSFLCPMPIKNKIGDALGILKDKPALMVSFLDGNEIVNRDQKSCYLVGESLAKLHLAANDFPSKNKNTRDLKWMSQSYLNLKKFLPPEDYKIIETEIRYHEEIKEIDLPRGIIHGDLFKDNVLFLNGKVSGFIDFYYACNEIFIHDIAIALNDWCIDDMGKIEKSLFLEFMKGYESVRALKVDESKYLNVSLRLASLRFWLSRLEDFHNVKEGEITFIKNPNHFKNILLDRQKEQNYAN